MKSTLIKFKNDQVQMDDFPWKVEVPTGEAIESLRAYTDTSKTKQLPIDKSSYKNHGVVYVKADIKPNSTIYLELTDDDNSPCQRNDVWSAYNYVIKEQ